MPHANIAEQLQFLMPLVSPPFLFCVCFSAYLVLANAFHRIADQHFPSPVRETSTSEGQASLLSPLYDEVAAELYVVIRPWIMRFANQGTGPIWCSKVHEVVRCWLVSWMHAVLTALLGLWVFVLSTTPPTRYHYTILLVHSMAYFAADAKVNPEMLYVLHHLCPFPFLFVLWYHDADLRNVCLSLVCAEVGSSWAHSGAVFTCKTGSVFVILRAVAFWISRPISMYYGYRAWAEDVPEQYHGGWIGYGCLCMFMTVAGINLAWMLAMILPRSTRNMLISRCTKHGPES